MSLADEVAALKKRADRCEHDLIDRAARVVRAAEAVDGCVGSDFAPMPSSGNHIGRCLAAMRAALRGEEDA